ncbi:Hypothetical predicted protein [Cloeon dipterum]|uniref:UDP-glucuronosyltransferase n=1 Tax=Cloeon dipterum TaxID=197152 RepID=A0A8S1DJD0_9INSE|nr:Hypothetical predicted protein [Cloeon dipterum]
MLVQFLCKSLCFIFTCAHGAKILAVLPVPSPCHAIFNHVLVEALADRGHDLIVFSGREAKNRPHLRYVHLNGSFSNDETVSFESVGTFGPFGNVQFVFGTVYNTCKVQLEAHGMKELLRLEESFDLIIYESVGFDCFLGVLHKFRGTATVGISAHGLSHWNFDALKLWTPPAAYPLEFLPVPSAMSFLQRLHNWLLTQIVRLNFWLVHTPRHQVLAEEHFGPLPPIRSLEKFNLFLSNSGPVGLDPGRFLPPAVKEVGCIQCSNGKQLRRKYLEFLEEMESFIFMSFGSNIKSSSLPNETIQSILQTFGELDIKVIWKFESESVPDKPANVMIDKWVPQQDILAHPKLCLFITHGGRLSVQEALFHGVPILAIPFYSDQHLNGQGVVDKGVGVKLSVADLGKRKFGQAIAHMLENKSFSTQAKEMSSIAKDQPESALERAVFWTEYAIRHKGAEHLQLAWQNENWYKLYSLDVAAALAVVSVLIIYLLFKINYRK